MIDLSSFLALKQELGPAALKPTCVEGDQTEAAVTLATHADGRKETLGPGDAINLPLGWKGEWRVIATVRKLYVITRA